MVDLQQKRAYYPLDLSGFVDVAPLLSNYIEFIEEEDTLANSYLLKELC